MKNIVAVIIFILCIVASATAAVPVESVDFTSTAPLHDIPEDLGTKVTNDVSFDNYNNEGSSPLLETAVGSVSYDLGASHVFATISAATYCGSSSSKNLDKWTCEACKDSGITMTDITRMYVPSTDGRGIVGYNKQKNLIIVAFRGSSSIANWISDLDFGAVTYAGCSGCKVHGGFLKAYKLLRPQMVAAVSKLLKKYPSASVTVTGHSLGAALAAHALVDLSAGVFTVSSLAGTDMVHTGLPDYDDAMPLSQQQAATLGASQAKVSFKMASSHYTYGQPRIGTPTFAKFFAAKVRNVFRLTHAHDPVPHLPMMSMGFAHPPTEVFWNEKSTSYKVCGSVGENPACSGEPA
jgi:hypothetical protein